MTLITTMFVNKTLLRNITNNNKASEFATKSFRIIREGKKKNGQREIARSFVDNGSHLDHLMV